MTIKEINGFIKFGVLLSQAARDLSCKLKIYIQKYIQISFICKNWHFLCLAQIKEYTSVIII